MGTSSPHQRLIRISEADTILLASNESLDRVAAAMRATQRIVDGSPTIQRDLRQYYNTTDVTALFLTRCVLDELGLQRLTSADGTDERNLDRDCRLEFRAARHMYELRDKTIGSFILAAARSEWFQHQFEQLGCDDRHADALHEVVDILIGAGAEDEATTLLEFGLRKSPASPALLADQLILRKRAHQ